MKRLNIAIVALVASTVLSAQTVFEAVKFSNTDIVGSARYMGVAGAFGALGGDVSAIKDNPAGLGVFRKSEISMTLNTQLQASKALWGDLKTTDSRYGASIDNVSLVFANKTWRAENGFKGLLSSNFSFGYNKLMNFNRSNVINGNEMNASMTDYMATFTGLSPVGELEWDNYPLDGMSTPYQNANLSWLSVMADYGRLMNPVYNTNNQLTGWSSFLDSGEKVTPSYLLKESGAVNEYSFGWSGNFNNKVFIGTTLNLQTLNHSMVSTYDEGFGGGGYMNLRNTLHTSGNGFNFNLGVIAVPIEYLRLGFSLHTPMFYRLEQLNYATMDFATSLEGNTNTPTDNYVQYRFQTPLQFNASAAIMTGTKGFISAEYVFKDYQSMNVSDVDGYDLVDVETDIDNMLQASHTFKVGAEYRMTENFSLRAGVATVSSVMNETAEKILGATTVRTDAEYFTHNKTNYITAGLGYRENNWYFDMAYTNRLLDEDYHAFSSNGLNPAYAVAPANLKTTNHNLVFTVGLRF